MADLSDSARMTGAWADGSNVRMADVRRQLEGLLALDEAVYLLTLLDADPEIMDLVDSSLSDRIRACLALCKQHGYPRSSYISKTPTKGATLTLGTGEEIECKPNSLLFEVGGPTRPNEELIDVSFQFRDRHDDLWTVDSKVLATKDESEKV